MIRKYEWMIPINNSCPPNHLQDKPPQNSLRTQAYFPFATGAGVTSGTI
jgi:hypothetical protein